MRVAISNYHVHQANVEKHATGHREYPRGTRGRLSENEPNDKADVASRGRQCVPHHRLLDAHTGIQQNRKVP